MAVMSIIMSNAAQLSQYKAEQIEAVLSQEEKA
jgi:hypothetical protein